MFAYYVILFTNMIKNGVNFVGTKLLHCLLTVLTSGELET
jgi:hypothetical protein